jgi:hypothetical protein
VFERHVNARFEARRERVVVVVVARKGVVGGFDVSRFLSRQADSAPRRARFDADSPRGRVRAARVAGLRHKRERTRGFHARAHARESRVASRLSPRAMSGAPPDPRGECPETPADDDDVSRLLAMDVTPTSELAAVASARGFRDAATRARAWPKLLALDVTRADASAALFEGRATALNARERNQVELDVRRSHWIPASAGAEQRARLSRVIRGVLATHPGECRYYQGLHDVAAVLLLVCGDAAPAVLDRLVVGHLRDAVRGGGLDTVLETLRLLPHLIAVADPELHAAVFPASTRSAFAESKRSPGPKIGAAVRIPSGTVPERDARDAKDAQNSAAFSRDARDASTASTETENTFRTRSRSESSSKTAKAESSRDERLNPNGDVAEDSDSDSDSDSFELLSVADFSEMEHVGTCHFAVSWLLTWFAHSLDRLEDVSRLFDAFLSSDPLMPLYVGAAAVVADRETLLAMARGEMDENGDYVVEAEKEGKKKSRAMNRAEDWPLIEGMLHTRLSVLPALGGGGSLQTQKSDFESQTTSPVVRVRWKVVEAAGEDGGFRATVAVRLVVEERKNALRVPEKKKPGWGVEAVLRSAAALHARLPPRALYTVLGTEPDPFSAFAAYPYPWLAMNRWGFGESSQKSSQNRDANGGGEDGDDGFENKDEDASSRSEPVSSDARDARASFRLGEGASATALFAQRLGANIRRGVRRGVSELKKMEQSEPARGLRGFLGGLGGAADAADAVPRLND